MFVWLARFLAVRIGARLLRWGWARVQNRPARRGAAPYRRGSVRKLY